MLLKRLPLFAARCTPTCSTRAAERGGEWEVEVVVRVSAFDQYERTIDLPVA